MNVCFYYVVNEINIKKGASFYVWPSKKKGVTSLHIYNKENSLGNRRQKKWLTSVTYWITKEKAY